MLSRAELTLPLYHLLGSMLLSKLNMNKDLDGLLNLSLATLFASSILIKAQFENFVSVYIAGLYFTYF